MADSVRITVEAPGYIDTVTVDAEEGVVLGRVPDPARAALQLGDDLMLRGHAVAAPSVSSNHAAVWGDEAALHVRDLGSRNGTWVRVPPRETAHLPRGDIQIRLAPLVGGPGADGLPEAPRYRGASDYGEAIARTVSEWLERHDTKARVWVEPPARVTSAPTGAVTFRLATRELVLVQSDGTVDERFQGLMSQIARYVAAQDALYVAEEETRGDGMVLASPAIRQVHRRIVELAIQGLPRLVLLGPSGAGKERLARAYHRHAGGGGPLVAINCASLGRDRLVADLFGAEAGAYTGAQKTMIGAVERADGGTLFLDEVGDMPLDVQPQLLRFLDTGEYQRMGSIGVARTANVRVVAATNRDLRRMVTDGSFRADLFFRLALEIVEVPPLRQRFADVVGYLQGQALGDVSAYDALAPAALELLERHRWDGNFRELANLVRRLPRPSTRGALDAAAVQRALDAGALNPVRETAPPPEAPANWADSIHASVAAFATAGMPEPSSWQDMIVFIEQFLKPHALVALGGVAELNDIDDVPVARVAERVKADRGTVVKQLRRYFDSKQS